VVVLFLSLDNTFHSDKYSIVAIPWAMNSPNSNCHVPLVLSVTEKSSMFLQGRLAEWGKRNSKEKSQKRKANKKTDVERAKH
jgi:hypothetical protein